MFKLNSNELAKIDAKLQSATETGIKTSQRTSGCRNCNGQCKNGCGVTCVAILS